MDHNGLIDLGTRLGHHLMSSGAEISRVEDSILRLMQAYGVPDAQVFAIPNCLIISITPPQAEPITRMCRIPAHGIDLDHLELCNALCRKLCQEVPSPADALNQLQALEHRRPRYRDLTVLLGHFLVGAFFTPFFGGGFADLLCGGLCGVSIALSARLLQRITGSSTFFLTLLSAAVSSILAQLLVHWGVAGNADAITIGALMLLVPGVSLTTAMRDVMAGDMVSGITRMGEAVLTATAIALGTGASLALSQLL